MVHTLVQLGRTLKAQLAEIVTGGDATMTARARSFVSWCSPGIPFAPQDFDFAVTGIGTGETAEEERRFLAQAYQFATLVDFIPDISGLVTLDKQLAVHRTAQQRLSFMYGEILRLSKVVANDLTPENEAKLERWRNTLITKKKVKNLETGEMKEVPEESEMVKLYNRYKALHEAAKLEYNNKRIQAAVATGPEGRLAVMDWSTNQGIYRNKVRAAEGQWASDGYRNGVDELRAAISQMTARSMKLWKQRLIEQLTDAAVAAIGPGQTFFNTVPIPGNFANTEDGWTGYRVYSANVSHEIERRSRSWRAGGSVGWGLWSVGADTQHHSSQFSEDYSVSQFGLEFKLAAIPIARPWFYPEFFMNRGWMLDRGRGWYYDQFPSDGEDPPEGNFVGYATHVMFARAVSLKSREFVSAYRQHERSSSSSATLGWGPFTFKGNYSSGDSGRSFKSSVTEEEISVPGLQVIGFVNAMIPKSPYPWEDLNPADFE